jgi:hypothetical protein
MKNFKNILFLLIPLILVSGCSSKQDKYNNCVEECKKMRSSFISTELKYNSTKDVNNCKIICIKKYK